MEQNRDLEIIINQIESPAFLVQNDTVCAVNSAAAQYDLSIGQRIIDMIAIGKEEYADFQDGNLYLTVSAGGVKLDCSVTKLQNSNLFIVESKPLQTDLQLLSLAAKQLSFPLSELSILFDKASGIDDAEKEKINKILFQLHRITNNMSDAVYLQNNSQSLQTVELCSVIEEILEKAETLFTNTEIDLTYQLPNTPLYAPASTELLERAVYNLLSNAAKYGTSHISASLTQVEHKAYFSITNSFKTAPMDLQHGLFSRYKRAPGLEDPHYGLGLGMTLVHAIAKAHGGTVLVEKLAENKIKVTFSISLKPQKTAYARSPIMKPDIYGGRDTALIELSDVLPPQLYNKY